jgi:dTMP kinase
MRMSSWTVSWRRIGLSSGRISTSVAFITLEGIEGCGKSTQARLLAQWLGEGALLTREPGGTPLGEGIRALLLDPRHAGMAPVAESLLFFADRAEHVARKVQPALANGQVVVCDRYVDSSLAYQGFGRGLPLAALDAVAALATGGLIPDVTFLLDLPVEVGFDRIGRRGPADRLESEERAFHDRVREGFRKLAARHPERWCVLDGTCEPHEIGGLIRDEVQRRRLARGGGA